MREVITKINREKGYNYRVTKEGDVIKESYNWIKDPYTLVMITIVILGILFYYQVSQMKTTEKNFELSCLEYIKLRDIWIKQNPGEIPTLKEVFSMDVSDMKLDIPNNNRDE